MRQLFQAFLILGMSSFGGGLSGWMHRELVQKRQWVTMPEFLTGLSLARAMPGMNAINLAIWIGYKLRGRRGAGAAACGTLAVPLVLIIICAWLYGQWGHSVRVHQVLLGVMSAALGLTLSMAVSSLRPAAPNIFYAIIIVLVFAAIGILHWPMLPVFGVLGTASVLWSFFMDKADEK